MAGRCFRGPGSKRVALGSRASAPSARPRFGDIAAEAVAAQNAGRARYASLSPSPFTDVRMSMNETMTVAVPTSSTGFRPLPKSRARPSKISR